MPELPQEPSQEPWVSTDGLDDFRHGWGVGQQPDELGPGIGVEGLEVVPRCEIENGGAPVLRVFVAIEHGSADQYEGDELLEDRAIEVA